MLQLLAVIWGSTILASDAMLQMQVDQAITCLQDKSKVVRVIAILPPKCGTRHFSTILKKEYGEIQRKYINRKLIEGACQPVMELHARPMAKGRLPGKRSCWDPWENASGLEAQSRVMENLALVQGVTIIGIMRDPIEMLLSFYSFVREGWSEADWHTELASLVNHSTNQNVQLGLFVGKRNVGPVFEPCEVTLEQVETAKVTQNDLLHVVDMLREGRMLLGTTENLSSTTKTLASELKWSNFDPEAYGDFGPRYEHNKNNKSTRTGDATRFRVQRSDVPADILQLMEQRNELDIKLHKLLLEQAQAAREEL